MEKKLWKSTSAREQRIRVPEAQYRIEKLKQDSVTLEKGKTTMEQQDEEQKILPKKSTMRENILPKSESTVGASKDSGTISIAQTSRSSTIVSNPTLLELASNIGESFQPDPASSESSRTRSRLTTAASTTQIATATTTATQFVGVKRPAEAIGPSITLCGPPSMDSTHTEELLLSIDLPPLETDHKTKQQPRKELVNPKVTIQQENVTNEFSIKEQPPETIREKSPIVQFSLPSPKRDEAHIMEFFQEQEKNLQQHFLSLPKRPAKKQRSPSPHEAGSSQAGLDHLDNLIKLMEQLGSLKDENSRLRKRCDYLESTRILLQAKHDLPSDETPLFQSGAVTLPKQRYHRALQHDNPDHIQYSSSRRPRLSSAEELDYITIVDSSSDQRPKRSKSSLHKRSFSTGSLEVPSDLLDDETDSRKHKQKVRGFFGAKPTGSKQKSKSSKWARVKKVLTGQKLYEDLGTTIRNLREFGRTAHFRYSTGISASSHETSPPSPRDAISHDQKYASGVEADDLRIPLHPSSSASSASSRIQETSGHEELSSDIWMGPPGWIEKYESRKESGASTSSEMSSVIEVTTMYLGTTAKDSNRSTSANTSMTTSTISNSSTSTMTHELLLKVGKGALPRRKSSPSLSTKEDRDEDSLLEELTSTFEAPRILHKSSSCKSADLDLPDYHMSPKTSDREWKRFHKTAWGKVKDIIHTRKDSVKKKKRKAGESSWIEAEDTSEIDVDALIEEQLGSDTFDDGPLSRSTPKMSPIVIRQHSSKSVSESPPTGDADLLQKTAFTSKGYSTTQGPVDVAALLAGSVSDEFTRKMQEWELKRSQKYHSVKIPQDSASEGTSVEDSNTSMDVHTPHGRVNVENMQRRMTESFTRKMQEWERLKYKNSPIPMRPTSPEMERKGSKGRKDDRQKSKRSREEKEKGKLEKQRERNIQKVEKEQVKLEKEKMRIEKERLRALEREAKLEKLKGRLSQTDVEGFAKNPVLSPLAEYKVTADFARKLHEWELKKGLSHDVSNSIYLEAQKISIQHGVQASPETLKEDQARFSLKDQDTQELESNSQCPPPLTLEQFWDSPEDTSPVEKESELSLGDETSVTEECLTKSNITTLERANKQILEELQKKEIEYADVQDEVSKLNEKLANVREDHAAEMARFHRDLAQGTFSEPVKLEVGELEQTMQDLENRIHHMENLGESLAMSMESAAVGKWQSIEGEENVHTELVDLVSQMRNMLIQATQSVEHSQKTSALTNFESLYSQSMKLQVQMNNLRLSHLERNREIMVIKRQLLLQEINNLILQADISRKEVELYQFQEAKRFPSLKRWNTFSGTDRRPVHSQKSVHPSILKSSLKAERQKAETSDVTVDIPHIAEEAISASAASSFISAPASPSAFAAAGESPSTTGETTRTTTSCQSHSSPGAARDVSHQPELSYLTPASARRQKYTLPERSPRSNSDGTDRRKTVESHAQNASVTTQSQSNLKEQKNFKTSPSVDKSTSSSKRRPIMTVKSASIDTPDFSTRSDSVPLHREIEELKKAKHKVERGSPTLKKRQTSFPEPSPGKDDRLKDFEIPHRSIPKQQSLVKPKLTKAATVIDENYSLRHPVMECTDILKLSLVESSRSDQDETDKITEQSVSSTSESRRESTPISDNMKSSSWVPKSPNSKQNLLHKAREKNQKLHDYKAISPKGSPIPTRGKPPLPKQTPPSTRHPRSTSPAHAEKLNGYRSKSVGEIEPQKTEAVEPKPLQNTINKFEKRATVCETEERPIELRKTPSPTLHLPRVGLVSRIRRLKPAAELLEESQRYRSGQSVYATRILQRYNLSKEDNKSESISKLSSDDKENSKGYVQAIVQRLSRETTPVRSRSSSRANSESSLHSPESPLKQSELVTNIVRKLSISSSNDSPKPPLKDLTNEGQVKKLSKTFSYSNGNPSPERTLSDPNIDRSSCTEVKTPQRKSCEVAMVISNSPVTESSYHIVSQDLPSVSSGPTNHQSLPALVRPSSLSSPPTEEEQRARAATYCTSEQEKRKDERREEKDISSPKDGTRSKDKKQVKIKEDKGKSRFFASLSPDRSKARSKKGAVGVLCKQSISFDLGVSLYKPQDPTSEASKSRKIRSWDPSESATASPSTSSSLPKAVGATASSSRPVSSCSEGETAPSSPNTDEKKRSRNRFLDSSWLQKSKRFFKVSK